MANPIDGTAPAAVPTVQAWTCSCGLDFAVTMVNPTVRVALTVIGLLPRSFQDRQVRSVQGWGARK